MRAFRVDRLLPLNACHRLSRAPCADERAQCSLSRTLLACTSGRFSSMALRDKQSAKAVPKSIALNSRRNWVLSTLRGRLPQAVSCTPTGPAGFRCSRASQRVDRSLMQVGVQIGRAPHCRPCSDLFGPDAQPTRRTRNLKPGTAPRTDPTSSWRRERRFDLAHHTGASGPHPLRQLRVAQGEPGEFRTFHHLDKHLEMGFAVTSDTLPLNNCQSSGYSGPLGIIR